LSQLLNHEVIFPQPMATSTILCIKHSLTIQRIITKLSFKSVTIG
jgi:hypothetical protein